ncbi:MAG: hypothetical protein OQK69_13280 [Gammaproteobacteria bacterium]|nr:hypothetical protein [Gammaproteobacteria bacterium]
MMNIKKIAMSVIISLSSAVSGVAFAACTDDYPVITVGSIGGGQSSSVNNTLTTQFKGNIMTTDGLTNHGKNAVTVCPGTEVGYLVSSTIGEPTVEVVIKDTGLRTGPVETEVVTPPKADCNTGTIEGYIAIGEKLSCNNKNLGGTDKDMFIIKSGM